MLLAATSLAQAAKVGDSWNKVIAEKGEPRNRIAAGATTVLIYPDLSIEFRNNVVVAIDPVMSGTPTPTPAAQAVQPITLKLPSRQEMIAQTQRTLADAVDRVKRIVNQPMHPVPKRANMEIYTYPGWFHPGAITPDFNNVDVRQTQQCDYDNEPYIASKEKPELIFVGKEAEFNPMTKFFYTDRSVPKKKLTEAEMIEINRLYRIIGKAQDDLKQLGVN